jgi:hypothetical protein
MELMAQQQKVYGDTDPLVVPKPESADVDLEFFKQGEQQRPYGEKRKGGK